MTIKGEYGLADASKFFFTDFSFTNNNSELSNSCHISAFA